MDDIERRISTESRLSKLEERVESIGQDVHDTKTSISGINSGLQNLVTEVASAKSGILSAFRTTAIIGALVIMFITAAFTIGWLNIPRFLNNTVQTK
jgi:H2-forming N5,N10-methylenetetrahydromethanopterin dehydrogenase-like enzyme